MGKSQFSAAGVARATRITAVTVVAAGVLVTLTACLNGGAEPIAVPTVTDAATSSPNANGSGFTDVDVDDFDIDDFTNSKAVSFVCGEYSALVAVHENFRWNFHSGLISADAYGAFLDREAFQLSNLDASEPVLKPALNGIRAYLASTPETPEGWAYDPGAPEWSAVHAELATACYEAGAPIVIEVEPGMGG